MLSSVAKNLAGMLLVPAPEETQAPLGHKAADAVLRGGLLRGNLHEVFAGDASGFGFAACLARRAAGTKRMLWIVQDFSALEHGQVAATGLAELGIDPAAVLLMRAANATDALRASTDALGCAALGAVVVEVPGNPRILDLTASRRLVLAAQTRGVTPILLRSEAAIEPSAAQTRWCVRSAASRPEDDWGAPRFDAELARNRQGETGRWIMEWCCDDSAFRDADREAAHTGFVAAEAFDRPAASPPQGLRRAG
jgi:protein ImuA